MLITDPDSAVRAVDETNLAAVGMLDHGSGERLARPRPRSARTRWSTSGDTIITAGSPSGQASCRRSSRANIPIGTRLERRPERHRHLQGDPGAAVRRPLVARVGAGADPEGGSAAQLTACSDARRRSRRRCCCSSRCSCRSRSSRPTRRSAARADLVLVLLIAIALLRGSIFGAVGRVRRRPPARHGEPRHARLHLARCSPSPASGSGATARRPRATASTRRSPRSR